MEKLKCYIMMVSRFFPANHIENGKPTEFIDLIESGQKIHTIRLNYEYWQPIVKKVNKGEAYISLRYWTGSPYNRLKDGSKMIEFKKIFKSHIEPITISRKFIYVNNLIQTETKVYIGGHEFCPIKVAFNDGLTYYDFLNWFFPNDNEPAVIKGGLIQFTDFKYTSSNID